MLAGMGYALLYCAVSSALVFVVLLIDNLINPAYRLWEEVNSGNAAVGMNVAGKFIGLGIISMTAITHNPSLIQSVAWTIFGAVLLIVGYYLFEWVTPHMNVGRQLAAGNRAVGLVTMGISIGLSLVVSACIT